MVGPCVGRGVGGTGAIDGRGVGLRVGEIFGEGVNICDGPCVGAPGSVGRRVGDPGASVAPGTPVVSVTSEGAADGIAGALDGVGAAGEVVETGALDGVGATGAVETGAFDGKVATGGVETGALDGVKTTGGTDTGALVGRFMLIPCKPRSYSLKACHVSDRTFVVAII